MNSIKTSGALEETGRIIVKGLCSGYVDVGEGTNSTSLIDLAGGLSATSGINGRVTVNSSEGNFSAYGDIRVGPAGQYCALPLPDGSFAGTITVKDSSTGPGYGGFRGQIDVGCLGGGVSGDIVVEGDVGGDITIRQDASGKIDLQGVFGRTGQIVCTGLYSGDIEIGKGTGSLTLIHLEGGLGDAGDPCTGKVTVNMSQGNYNADGDIHVGVGSPYPIPLPDVSYYGSILIDKDPEREAEGGNLKGSITVVGCHADEHVLDICVRGDVIGTVALNQRNCEYETATWECDACQ